MVNPDRRLYLQKLLETLPSVEKVFFQPPSTVKLKYPCIIYRWDGEKEFKADDSAYNCRRRYSVTIIDSNPDSVIPDIFHKNFLMSSLDRTYTSDNLNHWVYTLYF